MKNAIILHGMSADLDACFGIKLKEDLIKLGYNIYEPKFVLHPNITLEAWEKEMDKFKDAFNKDALLVCHSLGTLFILKYLKKNKLSAKTLITVAGGRMKPENCTDYYLYLAPFMPMDDEFDWASSHCENRYSIFNKDDDIWSIEDIKAYNKSLKSIPVELPYGAHFGRKSGVKEIPEIIDIVKRAMQQEKSLG